MEDKIKLEQYRQCAEDWRHYDKLLWEIPFTTATAVSAIVALIYTKIGETALSQLDPFAKICLISSLIIFVWTMALLARKIRFFQESRTSDMNEIVKSFDKSSSVKMETSKAQQNLKKGFTNYRAIHFQNLIYITFLITLIVLLFQETIKLSPLYPVLALIVFPTVICVTWHWDRVIHFIDC